MTYRCLFRDENGVQCRATSENPHNDGWVNIDTTPGMEDAFYCPPHFEARSFPVYLYTHEELEARVIYTGDDEAA